MFRAILLSLSFSPSIFRQSRRYAEPRHQRKTKKTKKKKTSNIPKPLLIKDAIQILPYRSLHLRLLLPPDSTPKCRRAPDSAAERGHDHVGRKLICATKDVAGGSRSRSSSSSINIASTRK